jgi:hypothetical protein
VVTPAVLTFKIEIPEYIDVLFPLTTIYAPLVSAYISAFIIKMLEVISPLMVVEILEVAPVLFT